MPIALAVAVVAAWPASSARQASIRRATHGVSIVGATLTSAARGSATVASLTVVNGTAQTIRLERVTSPLARIGSLHVDSDMCQEGTTMIAIPEVDVDPGHRQVLGYRHEGAMLGGLRTALHVGAIVELSVRWQVGAGPLRVTSTRATVVAPPPGLHATMAGMVGMGAGS